MIRWVERHRSKIWIVMFFVLVTHADVALPKIKETLSQRVPDVLVFLYPEKGNEYAIVVEKDTQRLFLYGLKSAYRKIYDMKCSTGEVHGAKTRSHNVSSCSLRSEYRIAIPVCDMPISYVSGNTSATRVPTLSHGFATALVSHPI